MPPLPTVQKGINQRIATILLATMTAILLRWMRPYQLAWLQDQSRFKAGVMSRQIGKSEVIVLEAVLVALQPPKTPEQIVLLVSSSDAQARELLRKALRWCDLFDAVLKRALGPQATIYGGKPTGEIIPLVNGVRIISFPANPRTAAGFTGHVFWDEAGRTPYDKLMWEALKPITDEGKYLFRMTGTPWGDQGIFYETCCAGGTRGGAKGKPIPKAGWSLHHVTVEEAIADGLDRDIEELKQQFDPITLQQDYYCEFVSTVNQVFGRDLLDDACKLPLDAPPFLSLDVRRALGIDIGRTHDKTVGVWTAEWPDDYFQVERVHPIYQCPFPEQEDFFERELRTGRVNRARIDATGLGMPMSESLHRKFPHIVEPVTFSARVKEEMVNLVLALLQSRRLKLIPDNDLISDMSAIRREYLPGGGIRYDAERTAKGHADAFWGLGMSLGCLAGTTHWQISFLEEQGGPLAQPPLPKEFVPPTRPGEEVKGVDIIGALERYKERPEIPTGDMLGLDPDLDGDGLSVFGDGDILGLRY